MEDIFFSSNSQENKLYLNKGDFKFEDITEKAGIVKREGFDTGVTVVDVNNDGFLDIYLSRGGWIDSDNKFANMLYINNGDLTFTEKAAELGIADNSRTINTIFFDYDNDNDLDAYVSNAPDIVGKTEIPDLKAIQKDPKTIALKGSDKLYQNDGTGHFKDVSKEAGILIELGFGLNPEVADFNNDGYLDIYVNNDFNYPDLVYFNNGNGTFTESRDKLVQHMSFNSMGGDVADINNDGFLDLLTLDMNPEDYVRSKTTMGMTSITDFYNMLDKGYHYQYMHNMLQLNNGNGTLSEISQMAGIGNTDWSWSMLSADFDLDGFNDIYITNGVFRDVIDRDSNNKILDILRANNRKPTKEDFLEFTKMLPQQKLTNYFFKNNGDLTFENTSKKWNDSVPTFSNGAAYADFDNDGDLDIVVNNINEKATLLKNNAIDQQLGNYLQLTFKGPSTNTFGTGVIANIYLKNGSKLTRQLFNTRGFLSAVSNKLHFGIDKKDVIDKLEIVWQDGKKQEISSPKPNQLLAINYSDASNIEASKTTDTPLFSMVATNYSHSDPFYNDFQNQVLLPHKLSQLGPGIAKGDVNKDGNDDIYIGGGHNQAGQLLIGKADGSFTTLSIPIFNTDKKYEDIGATFFDADNDGDLDLYVVSGSYEFDENPELLQDRLYLNDGKGQFKAGKLPTIASAGSVAVAADYDNDGDLDLFVGGRIIPGKYPYAPTSYLLKNNKGEFSIETTTVAADLEHIGMVTDAIWFDINNDKKLDLIVCGEWMGLEVFLNKNGKLEKSNNYKNLTNSKGWWNKLVLADVDNDGDLDIIAGNLGLNYKFHASQKKPFHVYTKDFDFNGIEDVFLAKEYHNKQVPIRGKGCTAQQMPHLKNKIRSYNDFASHDIEGIVGPGIKTALHYEVTEFRSGIFINEGENNFKFQPFENQVQRSPINSILFNDFDKDGINDILLAGNNFQAEVETTKADGGIGCFLKGDKKGFNYVSNLKSGFFANTDIRNMVQLKTGSINQIFVANNNAKHRIFKIN